jgi:type IX secretion system PorP/SprF family membrane protein
MRAGKKNSMVLWLAVALALSARAQQTPSYTQFVLNQFALNPAVAGTNLGFEAVAGTRVQWIGMPNAPVTNFGSVTYGWRKNFSYRGHHGLGFYAEDDRQGMFSSKAAYLAYAYHLRIFTGVHIGAALSAGVRRMGLNQLLYDYTDPALSFQKGFGYLYPDIIPGLRVYTKKLFFDASIRQVYVNRIKQGSFQIGTEGSALDPTLVFAVKRRFALGNNDWVLVPAVMTQYALRSLPYVQGNCMLFYKHRLGAGLSMRGTAFAAAMVQARITKTIIAGIAYDYTVNKLRAASAHTVELILNFRAGGVDDEANRPRFNVAQCPDFDF